MDKVDGELRFENKYILSAGQIELLKCHLEGICSQDVFSDTRGTYDIRSLYFDDFEGSS